MKILVTGAAGMIGCHLVKALLEAGYEVVGVDRKEGHESRANHVVADLDDADAIKRIAEENGVDRMIHLAALAHTAGESDLSYDRYHHVNVECAKNVFRAAGNRPVLLISTVDVYGFTEGIVNGSTELRPVTAYGKTKALAEAACKEICGQYTIFRLSPVYTEDVKRDIQKRYYLKYPYIAYQIGKGSEYEVLSIDAAVSAMVDWCGERVENNIRILKDSQNMKTIDCINAEKVEGRAKIVLRFPRWLVESGYAILCALIGRNKYTYLLNKAVHPLRSE